MENMVKESEGQEKREIDMESGYGKLSKQI